MKKGFALGEDGFFLSATNPIATLDQRDLEALALEVIRLPTIIRAREQAVRSWRKIVGDDVPAEAWPRFDSLIDEWVYHYALMAVNSDANFPKVLGHLFGPPHQWFGMSVPGSRSSGADNPDSNQSIIPIDATARFELRGKCFDPAPADVPFVLNGNISLSQTLNCLDWQDVQISPDGTFLITLDPEPANGRPNHIQTKPGARYLFIRDCRADWRQVSNAYRIERLDPPAAPPLTIEQMAERAAAFIVEDVPMMYRVMRATSAFEPNTFSAPFNSSKVGGLDTQMLSMARLKLADDEAFVITIGPGETRFRDLVLYDHWLRTFDYWNNTSTLNNSQGTVNKDGSTTYVISIQDPGVHNWLDTAGCHEVPVIHRWQGLAREPVSANVPWIKGELVKLHDVEAVLPRETKWVTPVERREQIAQRQETFALRYVDS